MVYGEREESAFYRLHRISINCHNPDMLHYCGLWELVYIILYIQWI